MTSPVTATAEFRKRAGLDILTWPAFDPFAVDVMVTTRQGGVSAGGDGGFATLNLSFQVGDDPASVLANRRRVADALGAGLGDFVFARQVHGSGTRIVSEADRGRGAETMGSAVAGTDALVTAEPGLVLAVLVADCVPIVLYDPGAHVLACVHAGWRGTAARVARTALAAMGSLGTRPAEVIAGIGPAVAPGGYQVGEDVAAAMRESFPASSGRFLTPGDGTPGAGTWLLDLWEANAAALREAGVQPANIHVAGVPTGPDPGLFFSHRAHRPCGRFAAVARLKPRGRA